MSTTTKLAERTGIDRSEVSELLDLLREKGWVKVIRAREEKPILWVLTDEGRKILPPFTADGYDSIGALEAQELALSARDCYLSKGWYFALARQDPELKRKVDCVAYDYERRLAVAVEIESSGHVLHHIEQVKQHMMEISPFEEVHFWAHKEAMEKILELRDRLRPEDQVRVVVFPVSEEFQFQ